VRQFLEPRELRPCLDEISVSGVEFVLCGTFLFFAPAAIDLLRSSFRYCHSRTGFVFFLVARAFFGFIQFGLGDRDFRFELVVLRIEFGSFEPRNLVIGFDQLAFTHRNRLNAAAEFRSETYLLNFDCARQTQSRGLSTKRVEIPDRAACSDEQPEHQCD
jgi:hypothetical protein